MMIYNAFREMKRIVQSSGFWLSVGLALIIILTTNAYQEQGGTTYNVWMAAFLFDKAELLKMGLNMQTRFALSLQAALPMYGPLFAALSFASVICEEQKYGVRRYLIFKQGKVHYVLSKALSAICASGLVFLVTALLFMLFMYWRYPLMSANGVEDFQSWIEFHSTAPDGTPILLFSWFGEHAYCILQLIGVFLYGMFCGFIGYICTAFFSNVYLAVCIPFFFGYIYYSISQTITGRMIEGSISMEIYNAMNTYVSPNGYMYFWRMTEGLMVNMLVLVGVWIVAVGIHMLCVQKATDCGVK